MMRISVLILSIVFIMSLSPVWAEDTPVEKAYSLFYQGKAEKAIELMEQYVEKTPDPKAYYFLGYAYYERKQMDKSREYFSRAFTHEPFYSPVVPKK